MLKKQGAQTTPPPYDSWIDKVSIFWPFVSGGRGWRLFKFELIKFRKLTISNVTCKYVIPNFPSKTQCKNIKEKK